MTRMLPVVCLLLAPALAGADVWDVQAQNDNTDATENELVHGSDQLHDLGVLPGPDADWYRLSQQAYSSYEIVVDATSGDIGGTSSPLLAVDRVAAGTTTVIQTSESVGTGPSRSLRFRNTGGTTIDTERIRITTTACGTTCGADDVYRIRAYDTTYAIPRFNNSATQTTVLMIQNPTNAPVGVIVYFWDTAGTLLLTHVPPAPLAPKSLYVLQTQPILPGAAGAITISNLAPFGRLAGKAVALEPATGFSFDTLMTPIPH
jgi:hypothetical protein